jgi:hypothetical protein
MRDKPTVEEWLAKLPLELQIITQELMEVARRNMPGIHEFIYHDPESVAKVHAGMKKSRA